MRSFPARPPTPPHAGASVYCQSQLDAIFNELRSGMFGNPHSANPSSHLSSEKVEEVRDLVLRYFKADPAEYQVRQQGGGGGRGGLWLLAGGC
jgi:hypothetical protein